MDRQEIIELAKYLVDSKCYIIDTETTGVFDKKQTNRSDVIDIAIIEIPTGDVILDSYIYSNLPMNYYAQKCHGISSEDIKHAPKFPHIWENYLSHILYRKIPLLAYNVSSDYNSIKNCAEYYGYEYSDYSNWSCIMKMYKIYRGYNKVVSLEQACKEMNVPCGTHRAKTDALAAGRVLYRMSKGY